MNSLPHLHVLPGHVKSLPYITFFRPSIKSCIPYIKVLSAIHIGILSIRPSQTKPWTKSILPNQLKSRDESIADNMDYLMEDTQNNAPGTATMHEAAKLNIAARRQDTQSVTKR